MKKTIFILLCVSLLALKCEKQSISNSSSSGEVSTGQGGSLARFTIVGNYLYTVDDKQLKVFDIHDLRTPVLKNTRDVGFEIETIYPFKDKLFIGSATQVHIFSIQNPASPEKLSVAISPQVLRRCDPVVAKDTVAYATLRTNGPCGGTQSILAIYDIKDILNPIQVNTYPVGEPYGLGYADDVLYVCDKQNGLLLFDISDGFNVVRLPRTLQDGSYVDVIPYDNMLICWVDTGIILYDLTDKRNPVLITTIG